MKQKLPHQAVYYLLGKAIKVYCLLLYSFVVGCILLIPFFGSATAHTVAVFVLPYFLKGAFTLMCGAAMVSLLESF